MNEIIKFIFKVLKGNRERNSNLEFDIKKSKDVVTISQLLDNLLSDSSFNLIPGDIPSHCHEMAIFVSLTKSPKHLYLRQDQLLSLDKMLPKVIQQVQGSCSGINKKIYILCDEIETKSFEPWLDNLRTINRQSIEFGIFYIGGRELKDITDVLL
jgi:hypothetical protein